MTEENKNKNFLRGFWNWFQTKLRAQSKEADGDVNMVRRDLHEANPVGEQPQLSKADPSYQQPVYESASPNNLPLPETNMVKDPELTMQSDLDLGSQEPPKLYGVGGKVDDRMMDPSYPPHAAEVTNLGGGKITLSDMRDVALRVEKENDMAKNLEDAVNKREEQFGPGNLTLPDGQTIVPSESKEEVKSNEPKSETTQEKVELKLDPYAVARMCGREGDK